MDRHEQGTRLIGPYRVVRLLGKGGMSEVYEVESPKLKAHYALKLFVCERADEELRRRFEVEGELLSQLNHPRIVRVTDLGVEEESGRPFFVMDLVLGPAGERQSLAEAASVAVDEAMVGRWYDDLREGLAYIHSRGVVHRDLKLQNVLIGPDGHAVLTDFGISKVTEPEAGTRMAVDTVNTIVKMREGRSLVMGSIGYMAPELEMGCAASRESDWYALGVIVFKLLTGTWCDARTDLAATLTTYDPAWTRILPKLLHANPQGRECLGFAEEQAAARERAEAAAEDRLEMLTAKVAELRRRLKVAVLVALGLFVLGLGVTYAWRTNARLVRAFVWAIENPPADDEFGERRDDALRRLAAEARGLGSQAGDAGADRGLR